MEVELKKKEKNPIQGVPFCDNPKCPIHNEHWKGEDYIEVHVYNPFGIPENRIYTRHAHAYPVLNISGKPTGEFQYIQYCDICTEAILTIQDKMNGTE